MSEINRLAPMLCRRFDTQPLLDAEGKPGPFQMAGLFTASRNMSVEGLVRGGSYAFQVRAVGGSTGYSGWSDPVASLAP